MRGLRRQTGALANSDAPPSYDGGRPKSDAQKNGGHVKRPPSLFIKCVVLERLSAAHVGLFRGADLKHVAFFDEQGHLHDEASFECSWLLHVAGGVAFNAFGGFDDFHFDRRWQLDLDWLVVDVKNAVYLCFDEELL